MWGRLHANRSPASSGPLAREEVLTRLWAALWETGIPNPTASAAPDWRPINPPMSLLLMWDLLQGRVACPRWVTWIREGSASIPKSDLVSASGRGAHVSVWKSHRLCGDFGSAVTCHRSRNALYLHTQTPQLSLPYHVCHFTWATSVCFTPNRDTVPQNHHVTPSEEMMTASTFEPRPQAHFSCHPLPRCLRCLRHSDLVFFFWNCSQDFPLFAQCLWI
ncbi:uncharacterized protein LOC111143506 [Enhydra lutris kenyoni]|uniref:Uncharacterized protein LOC111143506 n=1 Tax=Enhydra lutris kenyoni TaxID=391180 RepID=A0A2Y9J037_ENHLU|nr:uncharacterized protein LOC111143506 [Enhydra lutris kenyoni]